jgi:hypothetical protein
MTDDCKEQLLSSRTDVFLVDLQTQNPPVLMLLLGTQAEQGKWCWVVWSCRRGQLDISIEE